MKLKPNKHVNSFTVRYCTAEEMRIQEHEFDLWVEDQTTRRIRLREEDREQMQEEIRRIREEGR